MDAHIWIECDPRSVGFFFGVFGGEIRDSLDQETGPGDASTVVTRMMLWVGREGI